MESDNPTRRIRQEEIETAARRADVPDPEVYDTSMIEGPAPGNLWMLGAVIVFCLLLVALFVIIGFVTHVF